VTWQNGELNRGPDSIRKFYNEVLIGEDSVLSDIESTLTVDDMSVLHGDDTAIAVGSMRDAVSFKRGVATAAFIGPGKTLTLDSRWTATLVKKNEQWKIAGFHVSANLFSNPVMSLAAQSSGKISGVIGAVIGAIVAGLAVWLLRRRRSSRAAVQ